MLENTIIIIVVVVITGCTIYRTDLLLIVDKNVCRWVTYLLTYLLRSGVVASSSHWL